MTNEVPVNKVKDETQNAEQETAEILAELEKMAKTADDSGYPTPPTKDSIFRFFRELLLQKDSSKTGNIDPKTELGNLRLPVRPYQEIALYADSESLGIVADYLRNKSEIILSTSLSKKGFLDQLFVTQIKKEQKLTPSQQQKKGWFQRSEPQEQEQG